jgi:hypothetical protein
MCFVLRHVFIVSDLIRPIALAPANSGTFAGARARVSGWGLTSQRKCVDTFNLFSIDKSLLYSLCHMHLTEVTQKYII